MTVAEVVVRAGKVVPVDEEVSWDEMLVFLIGKMVWLQEDALNDMDDVEEFWTRKKDSQGRRLRMTGSKLT
jgi:hypothetical protein